MYWREKPVLLVLSVSAVLSVGFQDVTARGQSDDDSKAVVEEQVETEDSESADDPLEEILRGHSFHGEAFNEGPRQKAYLMGGTGNVQFKVTTKPNCWPHAALVLVIHFGAFLLVHCMLF